MHPKRPSQNLSCYRSGLHSLSKKQPLQVGHYKEEKEYALQRELATGRQDYDTFQVDIQWEQKVLNEENIELEELTEKWNKLQSDLTENQIAQIDLKQELRNLSKKDTIDEYEAERLKVQIKYASNRLEKEVQLQKRILKQIEETEESIKRKEESIQRRKESIREIQQYLEKLQEKMEDQAKELMKLESNSLSFNQKKEGKMF